ncbi:MAG: hypothetical protein RL277_2396 [Planctomycetota bacterium]|jgi:leucine dehydrogenase
MSIHLLDAMSREGFEQVIAFHDRGSGARALLAIHDTVQGPAFGGIRRWSYASDEHALRDCLRLARAMTWKVALAGLRAGGAKLVLLERPAQDRERVYEALGGFIESLGGRYQAGPDVGTGDAELRALARRTQYLACPGEEGPGELAEATAAGVHHGMAAALQALDGAVDWPRRTVVVQGLGAVGSELARRLVSAGARVIGAERDSRLALAVGARLEIELVDPERAPEVPCDVLAPCALGGVIHDLSLQRIAARCIAGAANNQLVRNLHGDQLHERGVLYCPDFVLNAGALIRGVLFQQEGRREPVEAIGQRIGATLAGVIEQAAAEQRSPARVANDQAIARIAAWRKIAGG